MDNISDFEYSINALNVLDAFYQSDNILYVEGDDDIVFWDIILSEFGVNNCKIIELGGKEELKKYINRIEEGTLQSLAARDIDFDSLIGNIDTNSTKILSTYGHSIENTIICPKAISKVIKTYGRAAQEPNDLEHFNNWLETFLIAFKPLIYSDIHNEFSRLGLAVLSDNCTQFMTSQTSELACPQKISAKLNSIGIDFNVDHLELCINNLNRSFKDFMRGHFYLSAALKYTNRKLCSKGVKKSIPKDSFFAAAILAFENVFNTNHFHYEHYSQEVGRVFS